MVYAAHRGLWVPQRYREPNFSADEGYSPPPSASAPADARRLWNDAFKAAEHYYAGQKAPDPKVLASNTAWKTLELEWNRGLLGKLTRKNPNGKIQIGKTRKGQAVHLGTPPRTAPNPGKTTRLGKVLEIAWIDMTNGPHLHVQRFQGPGLPDLVWNDQTKTLMFFPTADVPAELDTNLSDVKPQAKMFERWAMGRKPKGKKRFGTPAPTIIPVGPIDTVVYRSDKFSGKHNPHPDLEGSQEYVHQFDDGVFVEESAHPAGEPPAAVYIRGGRLDVEERGIVH